MGLEISGKAITGITMAGIATIVIAMPTPVTIITVGIVALFATKEDILWRSATCLKLRCRHVCGVGKAMQATHVNISRLRETGGRRGSETRSPDGKPAPH